MSQISTTIDLIKDRKMIFDQMKKQYPKTNTDLYLEVLGDDYNFLTKGQVVEFRRMDLGEIATTARTKRLEQELQSEREKLISAYNELKEELSEIELESKPVKDELKKLNEELGSLRGKFQNFIRIVSMDKIIQREFMALNERRKELEAKYATMKEFEDNAPKKLEKLVNHYVMKKDIIENALNHYTNRAEFTERKIKRLEKERDGFLEELKGLNGSKKDPENTEKNQEESNEKDAELENILSQYTVTRKEIDANFIKQKNIRYEIKRLDAEIQRLKNTQLNKGRIVERYYLAQNMDEEGDLICFSRSFRGDENIESEMTHIPRVYVDPEESLKNLRLLVVVLIILTSYMFITDILAIETNWINYHAMYILIIAIQTFRHSSKIQEKDPVFNAMYSWLDTSRIDIQYRFENGSVRTFEAICYHLELFYSDKKTPSSLFQTTEADILEASDERLINRLIRYQKELNQKDKIIQDYQEGSKSTTEVNQRQHERSKVLLLDAEAGVKRQMDYIDVDRKSPSSAGEVIQEIIRWVGYILVIYVVGTVISSLGGIAVVNVGDSDSQAAGYVLTLGGIIGFFIGVFTMIFVNRLQKR